MGADDRTTGPGAPQGAPLPAEGSPASGVHIGRDAIGTAIVSGVGHHVNMTFHVNQLAPAAQSAPPHEAPRAETPRRVWTIPPPSRYFTGRDQDLEDLRTALLNGRRASIGQVQAASGLGGIGKTQLALCYAHRHRGDYECGFFLSADSALALRSGLEAIGRALGLVSQEDDPDVVQAAVYDWLGTHERWLIVTDNADELALLQRL